MILIPLITYLCATKIFDNKKAAFLTAFVYTFSSYVAADVFIRGTLGETAAIIFIPVAFLGLHDIIHKKAKLWYMLPLGMTLLINTHILTAFFCVVIFVIYTLMYTDKFFKNKIKFLYIAASAGLFFLLSASFLFPFLEQMLTSSFRDTSFKYDNAAFRAVYWWEPFSEFNHMGNMIRELHEGRWLPNGFGLGFFVMTFSLIYYAIDFKCRKAATYFFMFMTIAFISSKLFPWDKLLHIVGFVQFPWRLFILTTFFGALYAGEFISKNIKLPSANIIFALFIAFSVSSYIIMAGGKLMTYAVYEIKGTGYTYYGYENSAGAGEYYPAGAFEYYTGVAEAGRPNYNKITDDNGKVLKPRAKGLYFDNTTVSINSSDITKYFDETVFVFDNNKINNNIVRVPYVYYLGYSAILEDEDGNKHNLSVSGGPKSILTIDLGEHEAGTVTVKYTGTTIQKLSLICTVISFIGLIAVLIYRRRRNKRSLLPAADNSMISIPISADETTTDTVNPDIDCLSNAQPSQNDIPDGEALKSLPPE